MDVDAIEITRETRPSLPPANARRKILLVDPIYHVHSVEHYRSALNSTGFLEAEFTVLTSVSTAAEAKRVEAFQHTQPRLHLQLLEPHAPTTGRLRCLGQSWRVAKQVEEILKREQFDLVVYIMVDYLIPLFALPFARRWFSRHAAMGVRGLALRHHGLRPGATRFVGRCVEYLDRWFLARALRSGAFRRIAFLDRVVGRRAQTLEKTPICVEGVDPVDFPNRDRTSARATVGLPPADFIFLMFGSFDKRKGVIEALESFRLAINPSDPVNVVIAGRVNPALRPLLEETLRGCEFRVTLHDRFISDDDLPNYFAAADCVVCAYKNFAASSGVLLHGASCGDLAVVSACGVMADAVREYEFGEVVELEDRAGFASALQQIIHLSPAERTRRSAGAVAYARTHDFRLYMGQFLTAEEVSDICPKALSH